MNLIIDCTTTQDQLKYHGVGNYTRDLVETMISQYKENKYFLLLFDAETTLSQEALTAKNVEIVRIGKLRYSNYMNWVWYKTQYEPAIKKVLAANPDVKYFCPYFWRYYPVDLMPTYVNIHDMALPKFNVYSQQSVLHNFLRKFQYWDAMMGMKKAAGITTDSEYTRVELLRYMPYLDASKIKTVLLGLKVDLDGLKASKAEQRKVLSKYMSDEVIDAGYFIYLGGTPIVSKNSDGVIKAYAEFVRKIEEGGVAMSDLDGKTALGAQKKKDSGAEIASVPYLVIAGKAFLNSSQPEVAKLYALIEKLGIKDRVIFSGFYDDNEKCVLLGNSLGLVHLSLYEGFGLAVGEGMLCGIPVIAHNGSSYTEVVGEGGLLVDGQNAKEVGDVMFRVWSDRAWANEIGKKGEVRAKRFGWSDTAKVTLSYINS